MCWCGGTAFTCWAPPVAPAPCPPWHLINSREPLSFRIDMLETHPRLLQIEFLELVHSRALLSAISVATVLLFLSRATLVRSSKFAELDRQSYLVGQSLAWFPGVWAKLAYALNGYGLIYEAFEKVCLGSCHFGNVLIANSVPKD